MTEYFTDTDGTRYELVNPVLVNYPREETVIEAGKKVVKRSKVEFTAVTAQEIQPTPLAEFSYRPPMDRVCPACGRKHTGAFDECSACANLLLPGRAGE